MEKFYFVDYCGVSKPIKQEQANRCTLAGMFQVSYKTIALYDNNGAALSEKYDGAFDIAHVTSGATLVMHAEAARSNCTTPAADKGGADFLIDRLRAGPSTSIGNGRSGVCTSAAGSPFGTSTGSRGRRISKPFL